MGDRHLNTSKFWALNTFEDLGLDISGAYHEEAAALEKHIIILSSQQHKKTQTLLDLPVMEVDDHNSKAQDTKWKMCLWQPGSSG